MVFPKDYDIGPAKTTGKRAAPGNGAAGTAKKVKSEKADVDIQEAAKRGNLTKLTVPILKGFCKEHALKSSSQKKADLIQAINDHFSI